MRGPILSAVLIIGAVSFAVRTNAQFKDDNVISDGYGNTGVGTDALFTLTPSEESSLDCNISPNYFCTSNTAVGNNAMHGNTSGSYNTAIGAGALFTNTSATDSTAVGVNALYNNNAQGNTAVGYEALANATNGAYNTALGVAALSENQSGISNTAVGVGAIEYGTGSFNTASGVDTLSYATGDNDTAFGASALFYNTTGGDNTASGASALYNNINGGNNTASGYQSLFKNTGGAQNTASGASALYTNTQGDDNTASGYAALYHTTGKSNIALGWEAGFSLTSGNNNIDIGSPGVAAESGVIRIGTISGTTSTQSATYVAGIYGVKTATAGMTVVIDSSGQLGTVSSSIRYKEDIQPMTQASERLLQLRPVKFRYKKADASGEKPIQYGLIAEEVAKVYPELVVRDQTTGRIDGVRYDELAPMLLNEMQKQQRINEAQFAEMRDLKLQVAELKDLKERMAVMSAALQKLQPKDAIVAQR